ncbi:MAG: 1-acyl-sn-glycerol-3-phosphate acyltransferase [Clostridia bacterium]|nr:1-acyl-sn-glycerol-3-phosphate acyltransferase [Clostridia bacterium]
MSNQIIPIFYACDDNFVKYTIVSLHSMIQHATKDRQYRIYVLHTNISNKMQEKLLDLQNENFEISFEDVTGYLESIADKLPIRHYYTKTTYFRLFIAEMFPQYDKVIYIDSDTIVRNDIAKLYDTEIGDSYVGACHEQAMVQVDVYGTYCERVVGVSRHNFFNAGMLLINCARFRSGQVLNKFIHYLGEYNFIVTQDEDYLNLICKDHVHWLDQRWNTEITDGMVYPYDPEREAHILHYIMANKPWHNEESVLGHVFWDYAKETSVYGDLRAELDGYTDEMRERDRISGDHLYQMAIDETARVDNYQNQLNEKKRSADRVAVIKRIEEYERAGKFDVDVEEDPPTRTLRPDEIDYLRRSPIAKLNTYIAYRKARKFLRYIQEKNLMIIKEIRGLEHLQGLSGGAVLTCNHFNAFDTFAIHEAFLRAGIKGKKLYRVIREGNYTSFPGFYGYLMRHFYTLPLSSDKATMVKFTKATDKLLTDGNLVLIYPEQSMWWNYRKPKPLKAGAYRFAAKNNVPVLPCFITMQDSDKMGEDGYPIQEYTIHIAPPIYPDPSKHYKDNISMLMEQNTVVWKDIYETAYSMPLVYSTETK